LINSIDSNQRIENIICNIDWRNDRVGQMLKKLSNKVRLDNRSDHKGFCLIKLINNYQRLGSLMWKTQNQKERKIQLDDFDFGRL
jgi:hypothetical protein